MTIPYEPFRGGYPPNFPDLDDSNLGEQSEQIRHSLSQLTKENQQLRKQLCEAEATIQSMIAASTLSTSGEALGATKTTDFVLENSLETSTPGDGQAIAEADGNILQQIAMLTHGCNWHEKMALATNAIVAIDGTHTQLCIVQPKHGRYSESLTAAIQLLRHLSPGAKAELVVDILSDDWELGAEE